MPTILFIIISFFGAAIVSAADDPCKQDLACLKAGNANFDNPNHFVFVGLSPGSELPIYPLLKDHCSETNNYCAMIFLTLGKSGCEFNSGETCGNLRAEELRVSAEYLNTDLWRYDLPGDKEINPDTFAHISHFYNNLAQMSGLASGSAYFEYIFRKLQFSNEKTLVVLSPHPYHGSQGQSDGNVLRVIDDFISSAIERLQKNGMNIAHYYADSHFQETSPTFARRNDSFFIECRKGHADLLRTNTHLTNFEVFYQGYYRIYPSQVFHAGELNTDATLHEFCYDTVSRPFDTNQSEKLLGFALTNPNQINEVASFSNAFSFSPAQPSEITGYLNQNANRLLPTIEIGRFFFDQERGVYNDLDILPIIQAIKASVHRGPILFLIDEPLWHIRFACLKGTASACQEIHSGYSATLPLFRKLSRNLKKALPGAGMMHIEAYTELLYQKFTNPESDIILLDEAEYLGYDCYGAFDDCGITDISKFILNSDDIASDLALGAFSSLSLFKVTDQNIVNALIASGFAEATAVGEDLGIICSRYENRCTTVSLASLPSQSQETYIRWVLSTITSLEKNHPIGRKMLLVPGLVQDFNFFPTETKAVDQFNTFLQVLDLSPIFGGMGGFIWGDLQEGIFPYFGARTLSSVRSAAVEAFRTRIPRGTLPEPMAELVSAMSLVGAIGTRGHFDRIKINGAERGDLYFQNAGMDSCSIAIGNQPSQSMRLNELNHVQIPDLTPPLQVDAKCFKGSQEFNKKFLFIE